MKLEDQIKAAAELDGKNTVGTGNDLKENCGLHYQPLKKYPTSYDAIIPVIQKTFTKHTWHIFSDALGIVCARETADCDGIYNYEGDGSYYEDRLRFNATPAQLLEALLRATGKWKE